MSTNVFSNAALVPMSEWTALIFEIATSNVSLPPEAV